MGFAPPQGFPKGKTAATRVVDAAGSGDFTDIQSAINDLPTAGGYIYVREGTYAILAAITPSNKPIKIIGSGIDNTKITVSTAIACFNLTFANKLELEDITLEGSSLTNQEAFDINAAATLGCNRVRMNLLEVIYRQTVAAGTYTLSYSTINYPALATSFLIENNGASAGTLHMNNVVATTDGGFNYGGTNAGPAVYAEDCTLTSGSGGGDALGQIRWFNVSWNGQIVSSGADSLIDGGDPHTVGVVQFNGSRSEIRHKRATSQIVLTGDYCKAIDIGTTVGADQIQVNGIQCKVIGCTLDGGGASGEGIVVAAAATGVVIDACSFTNHTISAIDMGSTGGVISDCRFIGGAGGYQVLETGIADDNKIEGCLGLNTSPGSIFIGPNTRVEGATRKAATSGTTTSGFVQILFHQNPRGILGVGTIKNTGGSGFAIEVREDANDFFGASGTSGTVTTTVAAGNDFMLDQEVNIGTARPPYNSYAVSVRHPVASSSFAVQFTTHGAE